MVTANTQARFAPLNLAAERGGEAVGGDSFADPYPGLLEALLDQLRGQPAVPSTLETRRSPRGQNPAIRTGQRSVGWLWRQTSSWRRRQKGQEQCPSPKSV